MTLIYLPDTPALVAEFPTETLITLNNTAESLTAANILLQAYQAEQISHILGHTATPAYYWLAAHSVFPRARSRTFSAHFSITG